MPELPSARPRLLFEIDNRIGPTLVTLVTAHAGVPLMLELFRRMGAAQVITAQVRLKQRTKIRGQVLFCAYR